MIDQAKVLGVILAGGQSRRMGGTDKALMQLNGMPMVQHVSQRLAPQTRSITINTNNAADAISALPTLQKTPIFSDEISGHIGPLAGIHAGMRFASLIKGVTHIATAATDTPFFPNNLVERLSIAVTSKTPITMARSGGNRHPVFALWPVDLADALAAWLKTTDTFKVIVFARQMGMTTVDFPIENGQDPFFNINTPDDMSAAENRLSIV